MVLQRYFLVRHHQTARYHLFDLGIDKFQDEVVMLNVFGRLKDRRIIIGIGIESGITFRIGDAWNDNRASAEGTRRKLNAKFRKTIDVKRHNKSAKVGLWTGTIDLITRKADSNIASNPHRRPHQPSGNIQRFDQPKVSCGDDLCVFY